MVTKNIVFIALMVCTFKANSQILVSEWNGDNTLAATYINPMFVLSASDLTPFGIGNLSYPLGCPAISPDMAPSWSNWEITSPTSTAYNRYIELSATFSSNVNLTWFNITTRRNSSGPGTWEIRWSINSYSAPLYINTSTGDACLGHVINLGSVLVAAGQTVTFRIYGYNASSSGSGRFFVDDIGIEMADITILPIEVVDFWGEESGSANRLTWQTASELNNSHFTVLRSEDLSSWEAVGVVDGAGNSQSLREYEFLDHKPVLGISYYKLSQTDFDGSTEELTQVVAITNRKLEIRTLYGVGEELRTSHESVLHDNSGRIVSHQGNTHRLSRAGVFILRDKLGATARIIVSGP